VTGRVLGIKRPVEDHIIARKTRSFHPLAKVFPACAPRRGGVASISGKKKIRVGQTRHPCAPPVRGA